MIGHFGREMGLCVSLALSLVPSFFIFLSAGVFFYHLNSLLKRNGFVGLEGVSE